MFCPLTRCACKVDCEAYRLAKVRGTATDFADDYEVSGGVCECYLINGSVGGSVKD